VVEARATEPVLKLGRESLVRAEHDPRDQGGTLAADAGSDAPRHERPKVVRDTTDPSAPPDLPPFMPVHDDMDALPAKPRALVEAITRGAGLLSLRERLDDGALGRSSAERELEQRRLPSSESAEMTNDDRESKAEIAALGRPHDFRDHLVDVADPGGENAVIEVVEPHRAPAPSKQSDRQNGEPDPRSVVDGDRGNHDPHADDGAFQPRNATDIRKPETDASACGQHVCPLVP
jgi:hypothetical protein